MLARKGKALSKPKKADNNLAAERFSVDDPEFITVGSLSGFSPNAKGKTTNRANKQEE
tara:strand:- start:474 stop:647 length:174 start_codon:yes stop_codon:yes gene_type:complete